MDWLKVAESLMPALFVAVVMLMFQIFIEVWRSKRKLIAEEGWKAKKQTFVDAIILVDRSMQASTAWEGLDDGFVPEGTPPSSLELNQAFSQLMLTAENPEIPRLFRCFFDRNQTYDLSTRGKFLLLLRDELFQEKISIEPDEIPWFH